MTDRGRIALVAEYRKRQGVVARLRRCLTSLGDTLSIAEELAGDAEAALAAELERGGPIEDDGRRYAAERRDGLRCVGVVTTDGAACGPDCQG